MKLKTVFCVALIALPLISHAGNGPTGVGNAIIGMSKANYISALGLSTVNCKLYTGLGMESLTKDQKTLCLAPLHLTGSTEESIQVSGIKYDVVEADFSSGKAVDSIAQSIKAIFLDDRLVSLEVYMPQVTLEFLRSKYGEPKLFDNRKIEPCQNRIGNTFTNNIGNSDAVWSNGEVNAIYRHKTRGPSRQSCTDGRTVAYYIIEEPKKIKVIEAAIDKYQADLSDKAKTKSPY